jgi:4-alpha-glucanotransferase
VPSPGPSPALAELARTCGVATEYWDWQGNQVIVSAQTITSVLQALGVHASDDQAAASALAAVSQRPWRRTLPPIVVCRQGSTRSVPLHLPDGDQVVVWAALEDGTRREIRQVNNDVRSRIIDDQLTGEATFEIPGELPLGWHTLSAQIGEDTFSSHLQPWSCHPRCGTTGPEAGGC